MKRLLGLGLVLAILVGALSSHGKSGEPTTPAESNEPVAAAATPVAKPTRHHAPRAQYTSCDQNISAGPDTTCGFADNVFRAYAHHVSSERTADYTVEATSPATGKTYQMACRTTRETILCTGGRTARVRFPLAAAETYYPTATPAETESSNEGEESEPETANESAGEECTNGSYTNSAGNTVCSPEEAPSRPAGATAECDDGTYSFSESRSGTCSHHGGVAKWL